MTSIIILTIIFVVAVLWFIFVKIVSHTEALMSLDIMAITIREARIAEQTKAFVDRRKREQYEEELRIEIDKLTSGSK